MPSPRTYWWQKVTLTATQLRLCRIDVLLKEISFLMSIGISYRVVIDDDDPRIQWEGDWFVWRDVGQLGPWGSPLLNSMHGFSQSSASLSFSFYGEFTLRLNQYISSKSPFSHSHKKVYPCRRRHDAARCVLGAARRLLSMHHRRRGRPIRLARGCLVV